MHRTAVVRALLRICAAPALALALMVGLAPAPALGLDSRPSLDLSATYDVDVALDYGAGRMTVDSVATVTNSAGEPVHSLTFNAASFRLGNVAIDKVTVDGEGAIWGMDDQSLAVTLPAALKPGVSTAVRIRFSARFLGNGKDKNWLLAKLNGTLHAYRWLPWLSRELRFDRPNVGEPFVTANSSRVRVTFTAERALTYVTSGDQVARSGNSRTFVARDVRDFNFVARPSFKKLTSYAAGVKIIVFYNNLSGSKLMSSAKNAVSTYTNLVGAYPYASLRVAESGGGNAMESPRMIWLPRRSNVINWLVAHEVAHQWFYGVVGNDQAREPFADEALATLLGRIATGQRVNSSCKKRALDKTIYQYHTCYYGVVYVQGADYLAAYRKRVGDKVFWKGVRLYYERYKFGLGGTRELLNALDEAAGLGGNHEDRFPNLY
jgi:hypothetical protein